MSFPKGLNSLNSLTTPSKYFRALLTAGYSIFMHLFGSPKTLKETRRVPVSAMCNTEQHPNPTSAAFSKWKDTSALQVCFRVHVLTLSPLDGFRLPLGTSRSLDGRQNIESWADDCGISALMCSLGQNGQEKKHKTASWLHTFVHSESDAVETGLEARCFLFRSVASFGHTWDTESSVL